MSQERSWEAEYQNPKLVSKGIEPRKDLRRYLKYLKKEKGILPGGLSVLDLGSGTGRNANFLAGLGARVVALELSDTALSLARDRAKEEGVTVEYRKINIGERYDFAEESFDLVLDVMSSNSLNEKERSIYLHEVHRVMKKSGYFFVRAICKDGDKNTKNLLKNNPGIEYDTYRNTEMDLIERVFSEEDFREMYGQYFEIEKLFKKTNYARFGGKRYRRNYWIASLKKK